MYWLRRITLTLGLIAALGVIVLDWELVMQLNRFVRNPNSVADLRFLATLLFGLAGLYSMMFLLAPFFGAQIMTQQAQRLVSSLEDQLRHTLVDIRDLRNQIEQLTRERNQVFRALPAAAIPAPQPQAASASQGRDYLLLSSRMRCMNTDMARVHRALGVLFGSRDVDTAREHLNQALALTMDPFLTAEIHYTFACVLARHGDYENASQELESAFSLPGNWLEERLAADIEEGGELYGFAKTPPYDEAADRLLMNFSVGA